MLAFFTVEPAVTILAVLIAYPSLQEEVVRDAFRHIVVAISRLNNIRHSNALAGAGADMMQILLTRAQNAGRSPQQRNVATANPPTFITLSFPTSYTGRPGKTVTRHSTSWQTPTSESVLADSDSNSNSYPTDPVVPHIQPSFGDASSAFSENFPPMPEAPSINNSTVKDLDFTYRAGRFLPTADLIYDGMLTNRDLDVVTCQPWMAVSTAADLNQHALDGTLPNGHTVSLRLFDGPTDNTIWDSTSSISRVPEGLYST